MTGAKPAPGGQYGLVERARDIAGTVLFPAALDVDASPRVPSGHLDLLAREGFYGLAVPAEAGGAGADYPTLCLVAEAFASGCLTTAFVWIQHHAQRLVREAMFLLVFGSRPPIKAELLARLTAPASAR